MNTNPPAAEAGNAPAFLLFQVGPVQDFIAQARKARDLWSGSYLISYLATQAMLAVRARCGDAAIIYPDLAGAPLAQRAGAERPDADALRTPCLPNRFLALVTKDEGEMIAEHAEEVVRQAWRKIAGAVKEELTQKIGAAHPGWEAAWELQVARFPTIDWLVHPWSHDLTAPGTPGGASDWARHCAATEWLFTARKNARTFRQWKAPEGSAGAHRDHLDGRNEALGGGDYSRQKALRTALRTAFPTDFKGEQLYGALSIIKRRWDDLCLPGAREWFPPTDFIAQTDEQIEKDDAETYYAVLMMDGDDMGQWLSGEKDGREVTREFHRKLSASLADFALHVARPVVEAFDGTLIYSGGDDALAMLPAAYALDCAQALVLAFRGVDPASDDAVSPRVREKLAQLFAFPAPDTLAPRAGGVPFKVLGRRATASVGIAVGHVKSPLQETIQAARDAEHAAKARPGKAAFALAIRKRSGEAVSYLAPWAGGVAGVWSELCDEPRVSARVAQHFAARVKAQVVIGGSATGAVYAPEWTATLREVLRLELRHILTRQAGLAGRTAEERAADWMERLLGPDLTTAALSPEDFLHFWLAWAFLRRTEPAAP